MQDQLKKMMLQEGYIFVGTTIDQELLFEHREYGTSIRFSSWDKIPGFLNVGA